MRRAHKLIKQIREALAADGTHAPVETLAADYARLMSESASRLDSCAEMIEKGSLYQALQLAETEPALLDLIAELRFGNAHEWDEFCVTHGLPQAPKFDAKAVQALDGLYARGLELSDPLGRDYRAAIGSHNYPKALQIAQSKLRLNPEDADARAEVERLNNKLFQLKLGDLRSALAQHDESAILRELAAFEQLAPVAKLEALREYEEAIALRRRVEREAAIGLSEQLVKELPAQREAHDWRTVGDSLARIQAMQTEHGFELEPEAAALCLDLQRWADEQRTEAAEAARFDAALTKLNEQTAQVEAQLARPATRSFAETERIYLALNERWKEAEQMSRVIPNELSERVRAAASALRGEFEDRRRRRQRQLAMVGVAMLLAAGVAVWFAVRAWRVQDFAARLAVLRDSGEVEAAEKLSEELRSGHAGLAAAALLHTRIEEVERWTREMRARQADSSARVGQLETANFESAEPLAQFAQLEETSRFVETLPVSLRKDFTDRLNAVRRRFETYLGGVRDKVVAQAGTELQALETLAGEKLSYDQPKAAIVETLAEIEPRLKALEARAHPPLTALQLPAALQERVTAVRSRCDLLQTELTALSRTRAALLEARSLELYREALAGFRDSRLTQAAEVNAARRMLATFPAADDVLAKLLMPGGPAAWAAAKADNSSSGFAPAQVQAEEIARLLALREDNYLNNIWEVTLIEYARKGERREVYARGEMRRDGPRTVGDTQTTSWSGAAYDPTSKSEVPAFAPLTLTVSRTSAGSSGTGEVVASRLSAVSQCLSRLELNRMTDATGAQFEKPLLRVFDDLVKDKDASPIFKAFLMQQLAALLNGRPYEWGLQFCPSLQRDVARLAELCEDAPLRSEDWLLERKRAALIPRLAPFFEELQKRSYFAEARRHRELVRAALAAGLQFGGCLDDERRPHLFGDALAGHPLWALSVDRDVIRLHPPEGAQIADARLAPFSPVFFIPLQRDAFLAEKNGPATIPFLEP